MCFVDFPTPFPLKVQAWNLVRKSPSRIFFKRFFGRIDFLNVQSMSFAPQGRKLSPCDCTSSWRFHWKSNFRSDFVNISGSAGKNEKPFVFRLKITAVTGVSRNLAAITGVYWKSNSDYSRFLGKLLPWISTHTWKNNSGLQNVTTSAEICR